ncbi:MAG: tetratricopeptide repeat protein [Terricaulis sp.]
MVSGLMFALGAAVLTASLAWWGFAAYRRAGGRQLHALSGVAATMLVALCVYAIIGRPALADRPFQPRLDALVKAFESGSPPAVTREEQLALWRHIAQQHPRDAIPRAEAGKVLLELGRAREAAAEFDQALRREPESGEAMLGMGRAIFEIEGRVTPEALGYFERAGERSADPAPWLYQAMAAMQEGRDARQFWRGALARMSADDPRRAMAQQQLGN